MLKTSEPLAWIIRAATPADHEAIRLMNDGIQQYEYDLLGYPMLAPEAVSHAYLADMLERVASRDGEMLVCEMDGHLVGFACGHKSEDRDSLVDPAFNRHAVISDLFVDADYRAFGLGQALMTAFADRMRAKGYAWLRIWAKARNSKATAAYLRFGFEPYETIFVKPL